jgi:uncharacterized membrane protein YtjA (UPF0391 family)
MASWSKRHAELYVTKTPASVFVRVRAALQLQDSRAGGKTMLWYAWVFLLVAIIAAVFGFGGVAAGAAEIAKILFFVFVVLFVISLFTGRRAV